MTLAWGAFKKSLPFDALTDPFMLKVGHIYMTLRHHNLTCIGFGDTVDCNNGNDIMDAEFSGKIPDGQSVRMMVFRDKARDNKPVLVGVFPLNSEALFVTMTFPDDKNTLHKEVNFDCPGEELDHGVVEMLESLRNGPEEEQMES